MPRLRACSRVLIPFGLPVLLIALARPVVAQVREGSDLPSPTGQPTADAPPTVDAQPTVATAPAHATFERDHDALPTATAVRATGPVSVDGFLDDAAWASAPPVTQLWQYDPDDGIPITEPIEVRFVYDDDAIYVGATIWDSDITTRLMRRDAPASDADIFIVYFDSYHDHRTAYRFAINPAGWRRDVVVTGGGSLGAAGLAGGDTSWDPVWQFKTRIGDGMWYVEERIPFSQLRFSQAEDQVWGLQIERKQRPQARENIWSWTPRTAAGGVGRFGHLVGIKGIKPGQRLEVLPYVSGRAEYLQIGQNPSVSFGNPFRSGSDYFGAAGIDLKYRMTSNLTLDGTVNPDFGQVELDPAVINLTAFETRYAERRPFFVEGAEVFGFGGAAGGGMGVGGGGAPTLVYSRRIGRAPQGGVPSGSVYNQSPETTTILGAAKLTGKMAGWSVGIVDAVTAREQAAWLNGSRARDHYEVEPATNYFAGRVRREMRNGQTVIGVLGTAVNRSLSSSPLETRLHSGGFSGGVDFLHQWAGRMWEVQATASPSYVTGSEQALIATQRLSSRYFQRPDAANLGVDSAATSLAGYSTRVSLAKRAGLLRLNLAGAAVSPGYEINDLGFQTEADRKSASAGGSIEQTRPSKYLRNWSLGVSSAAVWNYSGNRVGTDVDFNGGAQFNDLSRFTARFGFSPSVLNDRLTRGGPLARDPAGYSASASYGTDTRTALSGRVSLSYSHNSAGGWSQSTSFAATWRISTRLEAILQPEYGKSFNTAQFVTSVSDALSTRTYGRRYIFSDLRQTTTSLTTRLNATLTPEISLEIYAEPFISSARYGSPKELEAAQTFDFLTYGTDIGAVTRTSSGDYRIDPDGTGSGQAFDLSNRSFNQRSLQGNAVFRWEWRPGSTLFLVWQRNHSDRLIPDSPNSPIGDFDFGRDAGDLFAGSADNVFLVKFNYWLNP